MVSKAARYLLYPKLYTLASRSGNLCCGCTTDTHRDTGIEEKVHEPCTLCFGMNYFQQNLQFYDNYIPLHWSLYVCVCVMPIGESS